jgi:tetratricopeptide (TPR) repeat protein
MGSADNIQSIIKQAQARYKAGDFLPAGELFRQAAESYRQLGDESNAAEMMNNYSVALLKSGRAAEALEATLGTDQVFAAANDARRQALALGNQGAACEALGDFQRAIALYSQSADLLKDTDDPDLRAHVLGSLSALQLKTGDQLQSLATMHIALQTKPDLSLKERILKKLIQVPFRQLK